MYHPDLERKLEELKAQRKKTLEDFRDLASDAIENADRSCKTMMMFIPPVAPCTCEDDVTECMCAAATTNGNGVSKKPRPNTTRRFKRKKRH